MGDMKEIFDCMRDYNKEQRQIQKNQYLPLILELGAVEKSDGVYELKVNKDVDWFIYPSKGFCMNKKNPKKRISIEKLIKEK